MAHAVGDGRREDGAGNGAPRRPPEEWATGERSMAWPGPHPCRMAVDGAVVRRNAIILKYILRVSTGA